MKSTRRIGLLLTLVFLLPALFFSVYELSTLDKDEKMIQDIYAKQLETILFSVNQYTDDVLANWSSRLESKLFADAHIDTTAITLTEFLSLRSSIRGVFVVDTADRQPHYRTFTAPGSQSSSFGFLPTALAAHQTQISNLVSYRKHGFQKIERLKLPAGIGMGLECIAFIAGAPGEPMRVAGFLIDPSIFIEDVVGPRLQTIARDQFVLSVLAHSTDSVLYSTQKRRSDDAATEAVTKALWLLPDYVIGIRPEGETLQQIVRERTQTNFFLLAGLDVILITAVVLVFRNLKKEVDLAQNKTDFVSNVSHELRTPLALISMFAETLEMDRAPTEARKQEYYRIISKEAQRLTGIVNKILTFSQTEARKKVLNPEILDVDAELSDILTTYDFHLRSKGFKYELDGVGGLTMKADREAFIESLLNLIDNAVKYSDERREIVIMRGRENGYTWIAVKDFGVGISEQDQKHIFDKFYRVPGGNLARTRGTGLGLSLVRQLMENQNGKVTVESAPRKGTTFKLYFPTN